MTSERVRLPREDKIRLGVRVANKSGKGDHPEATDYFVIPERLKAALGEEKPRRLVISFPTNDPHEFAERWYELYSRGGLRCRGNGEIADAVVNLPLYEQWQADPDQPPRPEMWASGGPPAQGQRAPVRRRIPCLADGRDGGPRCPMYGSPQEGGGGCGKVLHLQFHVSGWPGLRVWQIDTQSESNIREVDSVIAAVKRETGGRIRGVPLALTLEPRQMRGKTHHFLRLDSIDDRDALAEKYGRRAATDLPALEDEEAPDDHVALAEAEDEEEPPADVLDADSFAGIPGSDAEPVEERPFEDDDLERAKQLVAWALERWRFPETRPQERAVLSVLGVQDYDGIVRMGIPEAQAALERIAEEGRRPAEAVAEQPPSYEDQRPLAWDRPAPEPEAQQVRQAPRPSDGPERRNGVTCPETVGSVQTLYQWARFQFGLNPGQVAQALGVAHAGEVASKLAELDETSPTEGDGWKRAMALIESAQGVGAGA